MNRYVRNVYDDSDGIFKVGLIMKPILVCLVIGFLLFLCCQKIVAQDHSLVRLGPVQNQKNQGHDQDTQKTVSNYDQQLIDELEKEYTSQDQPGEIADPLEPYNRLMFRVNDSLYTYLIKPASQGYAFAVPEDLRQGIDNAFYNVRFPIRFVSDVLTARFDDAVRETAAFIVNSIFGCLGFINMSENIPDSQPPPVDRDIGLTLGTWGIGEGIYIVWPVLGPKTLRSSVGFVGDYCLDPLSYVEPNWLDYSLKAEEKVNSFSLHLGEYEDMKDGAIDPYISIRNAYIQYRSQQLQE